MIEQDWIKECARHGNYFYSSHADEERMNDGLTLFQIEQALTSCRILEGYEDTGRGESCLVVGFTSEEMPIHIVCGKRKEVLVIITVYIPGPPKFVTPFQRGKK